MTEVINTIETPGSSVEIFELFPAEKVRNKQRDAFLLNFYETNSTGTIFFQLDSVNECQQRVL
jgi:hypothetical protein